MLAFLQQVSFAVITMTEILVGLVFMIVDYLMYTKRFYGILNIANKNL